MAHTTQNDSGFQSFTATAVAITPGLRVKLDSNGLISAAGVTDAWIGVATEAIAASGTGTVKLRSAPGSIMLVAAGAVEAGDILYAAASGKVNDVQLGGIPTGYQCKSAALADGDIFEAVPIGGTPTPEIVTLAFRVTLAGVTAADVVTNFPLTFAGTITAFDFVQDVPVTTGSKAATFNLEINTTDVTGGAIALTSALATPLGKVNSSTAITAANTFVSGDTLSIEASAVTAFAEGTGTFVITIVKN